MALPDSVRERLKAIAEANKGRKNLNGLDRNLGGVALDWVLDQDGHRDVWVLRADGDLYRNEIFHTDGIPTRYDEGHRVKNCHYLKCPWVHLSYAPQWLKDELHARWGSRKITYMVRGVATTAPVFPVAVVMELLKFLWPDDYQDKARKYVTGYSDAYVNRHPGVGAKVRITHRQNTMTPEAYPMDAVIVRLLHNHPEAWNGKSNGEGVYPTLYLGQDVWEVIG